MESLVITSSKIILICSFKTLQIPLQEDIASKPVQEPIKLYSAKMMLMLWRIVNLKPVLMIQYLKSIKLAHFAHLPMKLAETIFLVKPNLEQNYPLLMDMM